MSDRNRRVRLGSRLIHRKTNHPARIMAIAEGWGMVRPKGAQPLLVYMRELHLEYEVTKW